MLLGGLSTELMASADWAATTEEDKNHNVPRSIRSKDAIATHREALSHTDHSNLIDEVQELQQQKVSQRAFCLSPNGQILKPPVQILDRSHENEGNILIATKRVPKGQVIFTEKALEGIQLPTPSSTTTTTTGNNLYAVRACQNCFKSLEPASCLSSKEIPFSELWPVPEYESEIDNPLSEPQDCVSIEVESSDAGTKKKNNKFSLHAKSGRITCRDCGAIFCNRYCAKQHLETIGDCCRCTRAIEALVRVVTSSERERLSPILDDGDDEDRKEEDDFASFVKIDPVLVLATRMFLAQVQLYRKGNRDGNDELSGGSAVDALFYGLCGEANDIQALGFGVASTEANKDTDNPRLPPLQEEYDAIADEIELEMSERESDGPFPLRQFHKMVAIGQRNSISLTTGSPFRTYYQAMIRKTGGRGSSLQQQVVADVARLLGSKDGKLSRDMDRMVEEKCVVKMGGIFTLTARMNHSCKPNAEIRGQEYVDCNIDVVAKEDIHKGEEICISYLNLGNIPSNSASARNRRRRELGARYLFHCECPRCVVRPS